MFKVEKGIPVPNPSTKNPNKGVSKYPMDKLMVGESFLVPTKAQERLKRRAAIYARLHEYKKNHQKQGFTVRLVADGVRVWRIK